MVRGVAVNKKFALYKKWGKEGYGKNWFLYQIWGKGEVGLVSAVFSELVPVGGDNQADSPVGEAEE